MRRKLPARGILRLAGRLGMTALLSVVAVLIGLQFAHVINDNVVAMHELSSIQHDIAALRVRERFQLREIKRLENPQGTIPDIHEKLGLVKPNEAIIFLRPAPPSPSPGP